MKVSKYTVWILSFFLTVSVGSVIFLLTSQKALLIINRGPIPVSSSVSTSTPLTVASVTPSPCLRPSITKDNVMGAVSVYRANLGRGLLSENHLLEQYAQDQAKIINTSPGAPLVGFNDWAAQSYDRKSLASSTFRNAGGLMSSDSQTTCELLEHWSNDAEQNTLLTDSSEDASGVGISGTITVFVTGRLR